MSKKFINSVLVLVLVLIIFNPILLGAAGVKIHKGKPTLFINGKPHSGFSYSTHFPPRKNEIKSFKDAGNTLFQFYQGDLSSFWKGPDKYDFKEIDNGYQYILKEVPGIYIMPRISLNVPKWWADKYSSEIGRASHGMIINLQSMASKLWREQAGQALAEFVKHIVKSDYGNQVIGIHTAAGEEWTYPGCWWEEYTAYDYNPLMRKAFQRWLQKRYATDKQLQRTWNNSKVTFSNAAIPSKEDRKHRDFQMLRLSEQSQNVIDYETFASELIVENITWFAKEVKKASNRKWVFGAFYGYIISSSMHFHDYSEQLQGHLALLKLLKSPEVDIISTPASYRHRGAGEGWMSQTTTNSIFLNGKLFMSEDDLRTSIAHDKCGRASDIFETESMLDRISGWRNANAITGWLANLSRNPFWYDNPLIMDQVKRFNIVNNRLFHMEMTPEAEIAVFIDPASYSWFSPATPDARKLFGSAYGAVREKSDFTGLSGLQWFSKSISRLLSEELVHIGAPFHVYLLDDLGNPNIPSYKLNIFPAPVSLTFKQKVLIDKKIKKSGKTALWLYAAGLIDDGKVSPKSMEKVTGFKIAVNNYEAKAIVANSKPLARFECWITNTSHPATSNLESERYYRQNQLFGPIVSVDDSDATVLGETVIDFYPFPRLPALAVKNFSNWTSIYSSVLALPAKLLRNIAVSSGVHLFTDKADYVTANKGILSIHCASDGKRKITLRSDQPVYLLNDGKFLGRKNVIGVTCIRGETYNYLLGAAALDAQKNPFPPKSSHAESLSLLRFSEGENEVGYWKGENVKVSTEKKSANNYACRIEYPKQGCFLYTTAVSWNKFKGIKLTLKPDLDAKGKILFRIISTDGRSFYWDLTENLKNGEWRTIILDTEHISRGNQSGFYFVPDSSVLPSGALEISAVALLNSLAGEKAIKSQVFKLSGLTNWLYLGPFDDSGKKGIFKKLPPDTDTKLNVSYSGKNGKSIYWKKLPGDSVIVNLPKSISWAIGYFLTYVFSPEPQNALLLLGSDDGAKVWLNDRVVWTNPAWRGIQMENDRIPVQLHKGWNKLLIKINQGSQGWGICAQILSPDYRELPSLINKAVIPGTKLPKKHIQQTKNRNGEEKIKRKKMESLPLLALLCKTMPTHSAQANLYVNDFNSETGQTLLKKGGVWKYSAGRLVQSSGRRNFSSRMFIPNDYTEFVADITFKVTKGPQKQFCFYFGSTSIDMPDEATYMVAIKPGSPKSLSLARRSSEGNWKTIKNANFECQIGEWINLRIKANKKVFRIVLNNKAVIEIKELPVNQGLIGFGFYGAAGEIEKVEIGKMD